jgi:hypothetical protein
MGVSQPNRQDFRGFENKRNINLQYKFLRIDCEVSAHSSRFFFGRFESFFFLFTTSLDYSINCDDSDVMDVENATQQAFELTASRLNHRFLADTFDTAVCIHHVDITCDACEREPCIIGERYKCQVCEDRDLCESCFRSLLRARIQMAQEAGDLRPAPSQDTRPKRWISKLRSDNERVKWQALLTAVPCLHPSHRYQAISGPERAVVLSLPGGEEAGESMLLKYLETFPPSKASCADVAWIVVEIPRSNKSSSSQRRRQQSSSSLSSTSTAAAIGPSSPRLQRAIEDSMEARIDAALEDWEALLQRRTPTADDVGALARRHDIKRGKWLAFPRSSQEADAAWRAVLLAVANCALPCTEVKVSSVAPGTQGHVLCVYTEDWLEAASVENTAEALRDALSPLRLRDAMLLYKPDIMTFLGIYTKNEYGIKPTVYRKKLNQ